METKLTVFFEDPFGVGVFERVEGKKLYASKVTFGAEPTDAQLNEFVLKSYADLTFSPAVKSEIKVKADNPKRRFKIVKKTLKEIGVGTKAQQALKAQQEMRKTERKAESKARKEEEQERKFNLRQEKKKEKHKGH